MYYFLKNQKIFYITHWLHVLYYLFLIIHCKNFWKWFIGPFVLVLFERAFNITRSYSKKYGDTFIKDVGLLPSKVNQMKKVF